MRETERQVRPFPKLSPQTAPLAPAQQLQKSDLRVTIKGFRFVGNTVLSELVLQTALVSWIGKDAAYSDLQQVLNVVAETYRKYGWFARPQLPAQDVTEGYITIHIVEGRLGAIRIDDQGKSLRISQDFIRGMMTARQQSGSHLNLDDLDRSTNLLNDTPGVAASTLLAAGAEPGESNAVVKVQDKPLWSAYVQLDNQGARSTGENKLTVNGTLNNPFGIGDQIVVNANGTDGSSYAKFGYSLPIGYDGLRVGGSATAMQYKLIGDLASLKARGDAQTYGVNAAYPLLRSGTQNIYLTGAYDRKKYYNEANQVPTSDKKIDAFIFSLSGDALDAFGVGGMTLWSANLTAGQVDLSATATNELADQHGPRTKGAYSKLGYSLSRLQRLSDLGTVWVTINGQLAGKNLDSSEKMSLGGPSGVRAYPVIEGNGDDGWVATLEARYNIRPEIQLSAFYDHGWIKLSHDANYTGAPQVNTGTLKGAGLGVTWTQAGNFMLKAVWARRIGNNPFASPLTGKDQDGSLDTDRLWLSVIKFF